MQLLPRALVVGAVMPVIPGQKPLTAERINLIWSEVAPAHGFLQLQTAPDQSAALFLGATPTDGVQIQPPLIQVRSGVATTSQMAAESAQAIMEVILRHLAPAPVLNLGIKYVYHVPLPAGDARSFVLKRLLSQGEGDLEEIALGSPDLWGGAKFVVPLPDRQYTVLIEPLQVDGMRSLFLDIDAQFPGPFEVGSITRRAEETEDYIRGPVDRYLDGL